MSDDTDEIPEYFGDEDGASDAFETAFGLANSVCAATEACALRYGVKTAASAIGSEKGPEPLFSELKKRGYTFHVLYSEKAELDQFFCDQVFLILDRKHQRAIWRYVKEQRRKVLAAMKKREDEIAELKKKGEANEQGYAHLAAWVFANNNDFPYM